MKHRPKRPPIVTEHIALRMEPALREALERAAAQERRPLSHLMRNVLSDFVRQMDRSRSRSQAVGERAGT
jgi:hypothetical protein